MALTNSDIRFTVLFDDSPKIRITDNIQTDYNNFGYAYDEIQISVRVKLGNQIIFISPSAFGASDWYTDITVANGLKLNVNGNIVQGVYEIYYEVFDINSNAVIGSVTQYHNYEYTRPEARLEIDYNCGTSKQSPYIRSKDRTVYAINYGGVNIYGTPAYTSHKFNYPISSGESPIVQSPATSEILHNNLWTLLNTSAISSNCTITVQEANSTNNMTVQYKFYINAETSINVTCDECTCLYWHCFNNIYDKYYEMLGVNPTLAIKYKSMLTDISINYAYYHQALNCGEDATKFCNKLKELATLENCTCLPAQTTSVRISPVGGNSSLSYVTGGHVDGNGDLILTYNDATTTNAGHVVGVDGNDGADGADGSNGTNGINGTDGADGSAIVGILENDIKSLTSGIWTEMKEFAFNENKLLNLGDKLKIKFHLYQATDYQFLANVYLNTVTTVSTNFITEKDTIEYEFVNVKKGSTISNIAVYINGKYKTGVVITNATNTKLTIRAIQSTGSPTTLGVKSVYVEQSKGNI